MWRRGCVKWAGAHLFETHRDYDQDAYRAALKSNLRQEGLVMRLVGPLLLTEAFRLRYCSGKVAEIVGRTSFASSYRIEQVEIAGLPVWMHIELLKRGESDS